MKITISDIYLDTDELNSCGPLDITEDILIAVDNVKRSIRAEVQQAIKYEFFKDPVVKKYIEEKKEEMREGLKEIENG